MPTIGYNTIAPSSAGVNDDFRHEGFVSASGKTYTAVSGDTVTQVAIYASAGVAGRKTSVAIYTVSGGVPTTRVGSQVDITLSTSVGWHTASASIALTAGVEYTMCIQYYVDGPTTNAWTLYYDILGSTQFSQGSTGATHGATPLPSTWTSIGTGNGIVSMYATVTAGGGPTTLVVANAAHAHSAGAVTLTIGTALVVADASHGHSAANTALTQTHVLDPAAATHTHTATSPSFGGLSAVRFDAGADWYSRSAAGLSGDFTLSLWFYRVAATGNYEVVNGALAPSLTSAWYISISDVSPFRLQVDTGATVVGSGITPALGTWYYVAATLSGTTGRIYYAAQGAPSLSTVFGTVGNILDAWTFQIGGNQVGEFFNGRIAAVKVWSAALTQGELDTERAYYHPQRTANLWAAYPFDTGPSTADASGNGRTLTLNGTVAAEAGPPILLDPLPSGDLVIADAAHAHAADNVTLSPALTLTVAAALHGHSAENVTFTGGIQILAVDNAAHSHQGRTISLAPIRYPVAVSGRKLYDQVGNPYLLRTMASWTMGQRCTNGEISTALEGLAARNFNAVTFAPFGVALFPEYLPLVNRAGQAFFTGTPFASSLGPAWSTVDHIVAEAGRLGMTALLSQYLAPGSTGMVPQMVAAGPANCYNYGFALATRYADAPHIVWHTMGDFSFNYGEPISLVLDALYHGIRDAEGSTHRLITAEPNQGRSSYSQFISQEGLTGSGYQWFRVDLNTVYQYTGNAVEGFDAIWNETGATTEGVWDCEPPYVHAPHYSGTNELQQLRERSMATFIRGGTGINFGNEYWWPHGLPGLHGGTHPDWLNELADISTMHAQWVWQFVAAYCADPSFVPTATFLNVGLGAGDTKAATGRSGNVAVAYFPSNRSIIADTTVLDGTGNVRLRWYDPSNGTFSTIVDSEAQNPLRSVIYPPPHGDASEDYVLLVENTSVTIGVVANAVHGHTATDIPAGAQIHVLTVASAAHATTSGNVVLSIDALVLNVAHSLHGHTAETIALTQTHELVVADAAHSHSADNVTLAVTVTLIVSPQNVLHAHTADNVDLLVGGINLTVAAALHTHSAEQIPLGQIHVLVAVFAAFHNHTATHVNLVNPSNFLVIGDARRTLTVLDAERTAEATDAPD